MGYGPQQQAPVNMPRSDNLVQAVSGFDPHLAHLEGLVGRVFAFVDRIAGPTPSVVAGTDPSKSDGSILVEINRRSNDLGQLVDRLDHGISRLDSVLGG